MLKHLTSTRVTFLLIIAFAVAMAVATFIENDQGTAVARAVVYESWWFELIMVWMAVNFLALIGHYKLFTAKRWPIGLFHLAFVLIIVGAGVTRYFGREGSIHIREGQSQQTFYTALQYLQLDHASGAAATKALNLEGLQFEPQSTELSLNGQRFQVSVEEYIKGAHLDWVPGPDTLIDLAVAIGSGREDHLLQVGDTLSLGSLRLSTHGGDSSQIQLFRGDSSWMIRSPKSLHLVEMSSQKMGVLKAGQSRPLQLRTLYQLDSGAFLIKGIYEGRQMHYHAEADAEKAKELPTVVRLRVHDEQGRELLHTYSPLSSTQPRRHVFFAGDQKFALAYGPRAERLPFALQLRKFELERYPGSQSPASYASELTVLDHQTSFPYRVYMNHVLDYKGYRFYQASYDTDEKGTVLSVSQDRPGTYITYLAYTLLTVGMCFTFFAPGSRFSILNKRLKSLQRKAAPSPDSPMRKNPERPLEKRKVAAVLGMLLLLGLALLPNSSSAHSKEVPDVQAALVPPAQAEAYGRLVVQDLDGRMKPLNTLAREIVRKLSGSSTIKIAQPGGVLTLTAEQFLLGVQLDPAGFSALPLIRLDADKANPVFAALQHAPVSSISFRELLDEDGRYKLQALVEEANRLKPAARNESHKELLKVDERFNIFYAILTGDFLRLFPKRDDANNTWYTASQHQMGFAEDDALFVRSITPMYLSALQRGLASGKWDEASETLNYMALYQQKAGAAVYPSDTQLRAELFYNQLRLGNRLFGSFWLLGLLMLGLAIGKLFKRGRWLDRLWKGGLVLGWGGFVLFSFHLGLRWYVAGHAPWSDGFEMLIFVAWGVLLSGLLFGSRSHFSVPLGLLFAGTLLFVAFLDWLNPEITNLMPVLNSYWLKIHVAVIVSGYAPLALAALLALLMLLLLLFKPAVPGQKWWQSMQELSVVNEMSITIGLFLLTIGTFLGGVWANESWGRYWAWDPKETWALISIMVYAFVLHLRLIPALKNALLFNLVSLWSFSSPIMTSFGVNYYLSGLHSYAAGDPVPVPQWVYWVVAVLGVISVLAIVKYRSLPKEEREELLAV